MHRPTTWSITETVTHPGTKAPNCCLTSHSDHLSILPLSYWYSSKSKWLDTWRYSNSQMPPCASQNETSHRVSQVDRVRVWVSLRQMHMCLNGMSITCEELNWTKGVSLRQAGLRRKYCNPTQGSCIDPLHEAILRQSPIQVLTQQMLPNFIYWSPQHFTTQLLVLLSVYS